MNPFARIVDTMIVKEMQNPRSVRSRQSAAALFPTVGRDNRVVFPEWSTDKGVSQGFKMSVWVYACVSRRMKSVASVPWKTGRIGSDGSITEIPDHPATKLINNPNPYMNGNDLVERMIAHLDLGGNAIWAKVRANNIVAELWPLPPDEVKPVPSQDQFISTYRRSVNVSGKTKEIDIPIRDIVHFMFIDPSNPYWGMGPLQAAARSVDIDTEAMRWNKVSMSNRAISEGVFSFKHPITREQYDAAKEMIREQHQGADSARAPWILGSDAEWKQMSMNPVEMDFVNSRKMTRTEILAAFGVPPVLVGDIEYSTLSNYSESRKAYWFDTIVPLLDDIKAVLNQALAPEFEEGIIIYYDMANVLAVLENFNDKIEQARKLWGMGVPFNALNQRLNLGFKPISSGNDGWIPVNIQPASGDQSTGTGNGTRTPSSTPAKLPPGPANGSRVNNSFDLELSEKAWQYSESKRNGWYGQITRKANDLLVEESSRVASAFDSGGVSAVTSEIDASRIAWTRLLRASYVGILTHFGTDEFEKLRLNDDQQFALDVNVLHWADSSAKRVAEYISKTSMQQAMRSLRESGNSNSIEERLRNSASNRALLVAHTEVVAASNAGAYFAGQQIMADSMVRIYKTWSSSQGISERSDHRDVSGQRLPLDGLFRVGDDYLLYPGDPMATSDQRIGCKCSMILLPS